MGLRPPRQGAYIAHLGSLQVPLRGGDHITLQPLLVLVAHSDVKHPLYAATSCGQEVPAAVTQSCPVAEETEVLFEGSIPGSFLHVSFGSVLAIFVAHAEVKLRGSAPCVDSRAAMTAKGLAFTFIDTSLSGPHKRAKLVHFRITSDWVRRAHIRFKPSNPL